METTANQDASDAAIVPPAGAVAPTHTVTLIFEGSTAAYQNTLGYYTVDPDSGAITGVGIAFANAQPEFGGGTLTPGESSASFEAPEGAQVGAFLIANGHGLNDYAALGEGALHFLTATGAPATLTDSAPQLVHVAPDGAQTVLRGDIWHSAGFGDGLALHPDTAVHLRGLSENGDGTWTFGFEDLNAGGWDADFTDVTFSVDLGTSGATFLNADYDARGAEPDYGFGNEGDDIFYGEPGDFIDGGEGYDTLIIEGQKGNVVPISRNDDGSLPQEGWIKFQDGSDPIHFKNIEKIVLCFTPGTLIETDEGRIPVEELLPGDRVLTRDRGYRRLQWVGRREVTPQDLAERPEFAPVRIARGALGDGLPERDMMVSPQHRMLICGGKAELLFGESEVLVPARHLVGMPGITREHGLAVTYIHIMCDRHEIVRGDGCWSESFQPGDMSLAGLDHDQRAELLALFPELGDAAGRRGYAAARLSLKAHEARALIGNRGGGMTGQRACGGAV